ncbi:hypothetical protein [Bradyrhizobium sp. dw_78]|uniref:hypothetical protein n=1 Tax=Bradyrhizobium sp. dw_78 TaxID=2719793 RepID=UPI001BD64AD7|nr:hypothetical protein [Bradyrhizobium sp. dw_78]
MSEQENVTSLTPAFAAALHQRSAQAMNIQAEFGRKLVEVNRHWFEQIQIESSQCWDVLWKASAATSLTDKAKIFQDYLRDFTKRATDDASYMMENARALGEIETRIFAPSGRAASDAAATPAEPS